MNIDKTEIDRPEYDARGAHALRPASRAPWGLVVQKAAADVAGSKAAQKDLAEKIEKLEAENGAVLATIDDKQIQVSGHTDKTPISGKLTSQFPSNWELSAARATNVVRFLSEKANLPPQRLVATGYAEYHPIASNKTAAGRARNRRIEILLTPSLAPKAIDKEELMAVAEKTKPAYPEPKPRSKSKR